jgi:hypothetical protein
MDKKRHPGLMRHLRRSGRKKDLARMKSLRNEVCHIPLVTRASRPEHVIQDVDLEVYMRQRLGFTPIVNMPAVCACGRTAEDSSARDNLHAYKCNKHAAGYTISHNIVVRELARTCKRARMTCFTEGLGVDVKKKHHVIPDFELIDINAQKIIGDVTMTTSSHQAYTSKVKKGEAAAANLREKAKTKKFAQLAKTQNADFYPLAIERNTVAFGNDSLLLVKILGARIGSEFMVKTALAAAVVKANAAFLRYLIDRDAKAEALRLGRDEGA